MAGWREKWDKILEDAAKQQQLQRDRGGQPHPGPGQQPPGDRDEEKEAAVRPLAICRVSSVNLRALWFSFHSFHTHPVK